MKATRLLFLCLSVCFACRSVSHAQTEKFPSAPRPTQLAAAKKIFLSNAYTGTDGDQYYDQIYAALQNLNRLTPVGTPQEADLVLEYTYKDSFIAIIRDPKTYTILWTVSEGVQAAARQATFAKNVQTAIDKLAADIARITTPAKT